ncbi:MAG: glycosyltransferase family 2 protein [Bacteroidota bacterium]
MNSPIIQQERSNGQNDMSDTHILPLITLITPAYNEETIIEKSIHTLVEYMRGMEKRYRWEILIVNDGSADRTPELANQLVEQYENVRVVHHRVNRNLGVAMQTGFKHSKGDFVIVLDLDLSYGPDHIDRLMVEIEETDADMVIASPYMKGGKVTAVPFLRMLLSKTVNRLMRKAASKNIYTFTSMVRVYKREFLQSLNLKSSTYDINPEIVHKAILLRARIREIPAHLDWSFQEKAVGRTSSMRIIKGILGGLMTSFIFRPYMFFMLVGMIMMLVAMYMVGWIFVHTVDVMSTIELATEVYNTKFSQAVAQVFQERPHSFMVSGISLLVALQFLGIGFLSLQNKRYFDELFHINTTLNRHFYKQ